MYISKLEMIKRYGEDELIQLPDHSNAGVIDDDVLNSALADAEGEIDGYLSSRFAMPINPVPKTIVRIAGDIARYYLHDDSATEHVQKRYDDAVRFLKGVAAGKISIGVDALGAKPASQNLPEMQSGGSVFGRKDTSFI